MKPVIPIHIGVSGHRDIPTEDLPQLQSTLYERFSRLKALHPNSTIKLLSGLAEGADRVAAYAALEAGLELVAVLPLPVASYLEDFVSEESKAEFQQLLAQATVLQANQQPPSVRDDGYVELARFLVRHCQLIVALWDGVNEQPTPDGSMAILPGGTADVVRMSEQGIKVNDDVLLTAPEKTPVEHLWTRRLKHTQLENPIVTLKSVASWASTRSQPTDPYPVMQEMDDFNRHAATELTEQQLAQSKEWLLSGSAPEPLKQNCSHLLDVYAAADALAIKRQKQRESSIRWITLVALISIFCQQVYSGPDMRWLWLAGHIALAMAAWGAFRFFFKGKMPREEQFIEWRVLAEGLRVQFFWGAAGLKHVASDYYRTNRLGDVDWISQSIRNLVMVTEPSPQSDVFWVKQAWVADQAKYFDKAKNRDLAKINQWNNAVLVTFGCAIVMTFVTLLADLLGLDGLSLNIMVLISGMSFVVSALAKAFMSQMGFEENVSRYERAAAIFKYAEQQISRAIAQGNDSMAQELLKTLGWEALYENAAWLQMNRTNQFEVNIA
ncbi:MULTISPECIES: hypothetical protein [Aeromonas]|uniref:SMODS and SLOG-associating 2TM effector domain-containing protein n=1 Tax=Aeromonas caviae TaxID=648 RepID=A0AAV4YHW9_AERCA|nr:MULTISPECIES: hypothetical protein [Aeromonas]MBP4032427.1 hypothetical protein [Aeromonas sp. PrichA-15]MDX7720885.1 hypothetical protein [Aeromonas caviae]GJA10453.1 hypothetical protein KAM334_17640 [Aeromonas caviae]GJA32129.1 hypothetical protein KAM341_18070 [Aeromonas caviae]GJA36034.1 hypothetical protein KAM342_12770 [Aeromonas caviae]